MHSSNATVAARLESLLGAPRIVADPAVCATYEIEECVPSVVAKPSSIQELVELVRFTVAEKLVLVPCGARTKLAIGATPSRYDVALDMTAFNRITHYDPGDLTLSVEAGMPVAKLNAALFQNKQFLPLLVPYYSATTIGGTIASGVDSPLRQFYGTARDFLIGADFLDGKGNLCKSGGRVVKNVTGYDLHKLLVGSLGTLAVVTRLNFRTFPSPPSSRGFVASFSTVEGALALRRKIAESPLSPLTFDIINPGLARIFATRAPSAPEVAVFAGENRSAPVGALAPIGNWFRSNEWQLCAAFAGTPEVLRRYKRDLTRFAEESRATSTAILDDATRPAVWGRLRETLSMFRDTSPTTLVFKLTVLPSQHPAISSESQAIATRARISLALVARATGTAYLAMIPDEPSDTRHENLVRAAEETFSLVQRFSGNAMLVFAPPLLKKRVRVWGAQFPDVTLMRSIKSAFDPHNVFAPGRLL